MLVGSPQVALLLEDDPRAEMRMRVIRIVFHHPGKGQAVPENTACDVVNTSSRTSLKKDDRRPERIARPGAISSAPNLLAGAAVRNVGFHVEREPGR